MTALRLTRVLLAGLAGIGLIAPAAAADPGCQNGGALVVWARGSDQQFRYPEFNAFYAHVGHELGSTPHQDVELGNEDGDFKLEPGEYPAVGILWETVTWVPRYFDSRALGANGLVNYLNRRAERCPQEAFILGGFSQGADVIGDAILREGYGSLGTQARRHIGVVAQYGDPSHFFGFGILSARQRPAYLLRAGRGGSWCDVNDKICNFIDAGNFLWIGNSHGWVYKDRYIPDTARWIAERAKSKVDELRPLPPASAPPTTPPSSPPKPPAVGTTYPEQQGRRGVNTYSDYHSASGPGPRVEPAQWVNVTCKVLDPTIQSVNPDGYWYRIANAPWNDRYYAPANSFMNSDPWGGPYSHNTDVAVPNCSSAAPPPPAAAEVTLSVYDKVTNGASEMRADTPSYLSTVTRNYCKRDGCAIAGTDRNTGGTYQPGVCQSQGARTTNGNDSDGSDDANPGLFSSTRWYGVRLGNGALGYISEVWIDPSQRGGLGLPTC